MGVDVHAVEKCIVGVRDFELGPDEEEKGSPQLVSPGRKSALGRLWGISVSKFPKGTTSIDESSSSNSKRVVKFD